jgi:DNA primase
MDWVNFDEIKRGVTLKMVLDRYAVPLRPVGPNTLRGKCPLPTHKSEKSTESFTATLSKGVGGAWACQSQSCIKARRRVGGNALDFVAVMEQCSVRDAAIKLQTWFLVPASRSDGEGAGDKLNAATSAEIKSDSNRVSKENNEATESGTNKPLTFTLQKIDCLHPYLRERGLNVETIQTFGVGYFSGRGSMSGRIVIPIHNAKGELVAYAGRSIDGCEPRYKFPAGFHKSLELYNLHRVIQATNTHNHTVVVEGFFGCMRVSEAGFGCVSLMGSSLSDVQEALIAENFKSVTLLFDGDEAGQKGREDALTRLGRRMFVFAPILPDGKQQDMLSAEEIGEIVTVPK